MSREMPIYVDGKIIAFLSSFGRLLLWTFAEISKYLFCTAQNIHQSIICLFIIIIAHFRRF